MSPYAAVVILTLSAACASSTPTERERALERIPAQAHVIAAADGAALATPTFRRVLDAVRPHLPTSLGCVVDAAITSEAIAIGVHPDVGATIVLVTRAVVANCPAFSNVAARVWVATVGAGAVAPTRAESCLAHATWERARPYLLREPLAVAAELPAHRAVAVAQPEPVDAWVAIDSTDAAVTERQLREVVAQYQGTAPSALAGKLSIARKGTQISVHADALTADDLATIVVDAAKRVGAPAHAASTLFECPPSGPDVIECKNGTHYTVASVAAVLSELAKIDAVPVVAGGDIIGIRLIGEPPRMLRRDDVLLGVGGHRITESRQLATLAGSLRGKAVLAVRRDGTEAVVELREQ